LAAVEYPPAKRAVLGFQRSELALYDGQFTVSLPVPDSLRALDGQLVPVALNLQACNDQICLAPETVTLNVSVAMTAD